MWRKIWWEWERSEERERGIGGVDSDGGDWISDEEDEGKQKATASIGSSFTPGHQGYSDDQLRVMCYSKPNHYKKKVRRWKCRPGTLAEGKRDGEDMDIGVPTVIVVRNATLPSAARRVI